MPEASLPSKIVTTKRGVVVFEAEAGRMGFDCSALRDYAGFASPIIGAAYYYLSYDESAARIADMGYRTTFTENGVERTVEVTARGEHYLELYP